MKAVLLLIGLTVAIEVLVLAYRRTQGGSTATEVFHFRSECASSYQARAGRVTDGGAAHLGRAPIFEEDSVNGASRRLTPRFVHNAHARTGTRLTTVSAQSFFSASNTGTIASWWRSIFSITSGPHTRLPLNDAQPLWERITTLAEGFAFLGFEFRKAQGRMLLMWICEKTEIVATPPRVGWLEVHPEN